MKGWIPIQSENIQPTEYELRQGLIGRTRISEPLVINEGDRLCQKITLKYDEDGDFECSETRMYLKRNQKKKVKK